MDLRKKKFSILVSGDNIKVNTAHSLAKAYMEAIAGVSITEIQKMTSEYCFCISFEIVGDEGQAALDEVEKNLDHLSEAFLKVKYLDIVFIAYGGDAPDEIVADPFLYPEEVSGNESIH